MTSKEKLKIIDRLRMKFGGYDCNKLMTFQSIDFNKSKNGVLDDSCIVKTEIYVGDAFDILAEDYKEHNSKTIVYNIPIQVFESGDIREIEWAASAAKQSLLERASDLFDLDKGYNINFKKIPVGRNELKFYYPEDKIDGILKNKPYKMELTIEGNLEEEGKNKNGW